MFYSIDNFLLIHFFIIKYINLYFNHNNNHYHINHNFKNDHIKYNYQYLI